MTCLQFEDIDIGAVYSFEKTLTAAKERLFAKLSGDRSFVCADGTYGALWSKGASARGKKHIVHGLLAASLFSTLIDTHCPGSNSIYISQTLQFRKPLFFGEKVTVKGTLLEKSESTRTITLKTEVLRGSLVVISGEAKVRVLH